MSTPNFGTGKVLIFSAQPLYDYTQTMTNLNVTQSNESMLEIQTEIQTQTLMETTPITMTGMETTPIITNPNFNTKNQQNIESLSYTENKLQSLLEETDNDNENNDKNNDNSNNDSKDKINSNINNECMFKNIKIINLPSNVQFSDYNSFSFIQSMNDKNLLQVIVSSKTDSRVWIGAFHRKKMEFVKPNSFTPHLYPRTELCQVLLGVCVCPVYVCVSCVCVCV